MVRHRFPLVLLALVALVASTVVIARRCQLAKSSDSARGTFASVPIEAVRIAPLGDPNAEIETSSSTFVNLTYQVHNRGQLAITGLKLGTKCDCEQVGVMPKEVLPGKSAEVSFRLRSPYAGRLRRKIPVMVDGASEPVTVLDVSLLVKFEPPQLVPPPDSLTLSFVEGDRSAHELVFEAMETKRNQPWIRGLKFDLHADLEVQPLRFEEVPEPDPELTRRQYHFQIVNRSLPLGMRMTTATLQTRDDSAPVRDSFAIWVNVIDSVAILPNPLVIEYKIGTRPPPRRVRVLNRTGDNTRILPRDYDHDRLQIEAVGKQAGSMAAFEVLPTNVGDSGGETRIVFNIGDSNRRELVVRLKPSEDH